MAKKYQAGARRLQSRADDLMRFESFRESIVEMQIWELTERVHLEIANEELSKYGYGDFPKTKLEKLARCYAGTERKAQSIFKKMFPEKGMSFKKSSSVCNFWVTKVEI